MAKTAPTFLIRPTYSRVCREKTVRERERNCSEESMMIRMEAKDLENALFESKTTVL